MKTLIAAFGLLTMLSAPASAACQKHGGLCLGSCGAGVATCQSYDKPNGSTGCGCFKNRSQRIDLDRVVGKPVKEERFSPKRI